MKQFIKLFAAAVFIFIAATSSAQNTRLRDNNNIGWYSGTGTFAFNKKWSAHLEYQWRREDFIKTWQQSLLRTGINYHANSNTTLRMGYAVCMKWQHLHNEPDHLISVTALCWSNVGYHVIILLHLQNLMTGCL
jgi:Protein of unknown function (DUF2490)